MSTASGGSVDLAAAAAAHSAIVGRMILGSNADNLEVDIEAALGGDHDSLLVDIGSITKLVTAAAVLRLVDDGAIRLGQSIGSVWPHAPGRKHDITIRQLLTHSSGLPESVGDDAEPLDRSAFVDRAFAAELLGSPGDKYYYSNVGYGLLAAIVERVSGTDYDAFVQERLIMPNGLSPIGYRRAYDSDRALRTNRRLRTRLRAQTIAEASWGGEAPGWNLIGNGGAVSTVDGFLAFWGAFLEGRLFALSLVAEALTPHVDEGDNRTFYGFGVVIEDTANGRFYWHDGGNDLFSAEWAHDAARGLTFFVAARNDDALGVARYLARPAE